MGLGTHEFVFGREDKRVYNMLPPQSLQFGERVTNPQLMRAALAHRKEKQALNSFVCPKPGEGPCALAIGQVNS